MVSYRRLFMMVKRRYTCIWGLPWSKILVPTWNGSRENLLVKKERPSLKRPDQWKEQKNHRWAFYGSKTNWKSYFHCRHSHSHWDCNISFDSTWWDSGPFRSGNSGTQIWDFIQLRSWEVSSSMQTLCMYWLWTNLNWTEINTHLFWLKAWQLWSTTQYVVYVRNTLPPDWADSLSWWSSSFSLFGL